MSKTKKLKGVFEDDGEVRRFSLAVENEVVNLWVSGELNDSVMSWDDVREWYGTWRNYWTDLDDYRTGSPKSIAEYFGVSL